MMINPLKPCRKSSLKAKFLILPLSSCGGKCSARENAVSCLYDSRKELKGNQKIIEALKKVIGLEKSDYSGESVCKQRSMAIILLNEIGGSAEREYIESFLKRESSDSVCQSLECNAANFVLN